MKYKKIINDPVYGFIGLPEGIIYEVLEHPFFQRLRRIKQVGLSHFVYPGALHTRFHHALGAMHLALKVSNILKNKGIEIANEEQEALALAMLLHDIGHGPFSHALEYKIINISHEDISLLIMDRLNSEFDGKLNLCMQMYQNAYHRKFFHQLISSQLDLDRIDYLARDSFFTGVTEGQVAYDRILLMFNVRDDQLVVEEKGIFSIEKFLFARKLMYWQVYLHKTVLSAEQILIKVVERVKELLSFGHHIDLPHPLKAFLKHDYTLEDFKKNSDLVEQYCQLDDVDINFLIKSLPNQGDKVLKILSNALINRDLFRLEFISKKTSDFLNQLRLKVENSKELSAAEARYLVFEGEESNREYDPEKQEIFILRKDDSVEPISFLLDFKLKDKALVKNYICYPKKL